MNNRNIGFGTDTANADERQSHFKILGIHQWLLWLAVAIVFTGLLIWGIFGYVIERSTGTGLILPSTLQIAVAQSRMAGNIERVFVEIGDKVKKGEVLAEIISVVNEGEISETEIYLKALKQQQKNYMSEIGKQKKLLETQSLKMTKTFDIEQTSLKDYENFMNKFIVNAENLRKKGAISKVQYRNYLNDYYKVKTDLSTLATKRVNDVFDRSRQSYNWIQDIYRINIHVLEVENKLNLLKKKKSERGKIVAPIDGTVTKVFKDTGDVVARGTTFATIINENDGSSAECLTLVPVKDGKRIKPGMDAYVSPTVAQKEIYGTILGKVKRVHEFPLSVEDVSNMINDGAIAKILAGKGPAIAVEIEMLKDKSTVSGYKWTSNTGPDFELTNGTLCIVDVDVLKRRPITLVMPYLREFFGYRY